MKKTFFLFALALSGSISAQVIPFDSPAWTFKGKGVIQEYYEGKSALYLKESGALISDAQFKNGVIEFDMYFKDLWTFSGFYFRVQDEANYEELYFRPHRRGKPDAYQYCPKINGKASWQLYHDQHKGVFTGNPEFYPAEELQGYNGKIDLPLDRWMHVKLVVAGNQAELYLDREESPSFFINEFKGPDAKGPVGIYTGWGGVHFANFSVTSNDSQRLSSERKIVSEPLENRIESWEVSNTLEEAKIQHVLLSDELLGQLKWKKLASENSGITNLSRVARVKDGKNTVITKLEIQANQDMIKAFTLGYSDRVAVFCNGQKIYAGTNGYRTRDFRFLGTIGLFDEIYLPLKKGKNVVYCAVSESFGGWGVMGQIDREGIRIKGD
ncbi:MAG: family 16 glycoside hydrolase [Reichenbachiella sp.]|uniref:family 16 glycoside hydrolase n=1 Tax=Reichenbachiella sp. TaxID=2184521 RepID=UPI00326324F9